MGKKRNRSIDHEKDDLVGEPLVPFLSVVHNIRVARHFYRGTFGPRQQSMSDVNGRMKPCPR